MICSTYVQILTTLALAIPEISSLVALKFKMGHMTLTPPILRVICMMGLDIAYLCTQFVAVPGIWLVPTEI